MVSMREWNAAWGVKWSYRGTLQLQDPALLKIALETRHSNMCRLMSCAKNQGKDVVSLDQSGRTSHQIRRYDQLELAATPIMSLSANVLELQKA